MNGGPSRLETTQGSFSGHETFALRYSWPKKGVEAVHSDPTIFTTDAAMVSLGVGKNMVRAIRHWCLATRLIESDSTVLNNRGRSLRVTALGEALFGQEGADPYLEDPGTIWLLHWLISSNIERATTWRWAFGYYDQLEFTRDQLVGDLSGLLEQQRVARVTAPSLRRDVETFLHTYLVTRASRTTAVEDTIDCPLSELKLIRESALGRSYAFVRGPKPSLPDSVLGYAILDFWERFFPSQRSLSLEDLLYRGGAPGRILKLDEPSFAERLERAVKWSRGALHFDETAGLRQLLRVRPTTSLDVLGLRRGSAERAA